MSERDEKLQADRRAAFIDQVKKSRLVDMDAPLSSIFNATAELPDGTASLTAVYDDAKWFAIMP